MTRSREWQIGPSLRPIWAVGAHFRVGCGCWKLIGCFQFSKIRKQFGGSSANDGICSADTSNSADCTDRQLISSLAAKKVGNSRCPKPLRIRELYFKFEKNRVIHWMRYRVVASEVDKDHRTDRTTSSFLCDESTTSNFVLKSLKVELFASNLRIPVPLCGCYLTFPDENRQNCKFIHLNLKKFWKF